MARLLSWPLGLRANRMRPLSGPRTVGAAQSESIGAFVQTSASPFGMVSLEFGFPPIRGQMARRVRGWVKGLHGGANATRVKLCDWDGLAPALRGVPSLKDGQPWDNGLPWSSGQEWKAGSTFAPVQATASKGSTIIALADVFWGHLLGIGDRIGFVDHFGAYEVTEVLEPGLYRLDLPLRRAVSVDDFATLEPVLAMRLLGENGAQADRDATFMELTVQLVEVLDADVRAYFAD